jgi:transcriptional regulator with XRE-family HTH domain
MADQLEYHNQTIGYNIRRLREKFNISQKELAKVVGVSVQTISKMEKGLASVSVQQAKRISDHFQVPSSLFYLTDYTYEKELVELEEIYKKYPERYEEALQRCDELLSKTQDSKVIYGQIWNVKGKIYLAMGYHKDAYDCFYTMYQEFKDLNDLHLNFYAMHNLSLAAYYLRDYKQSLYFIEQVLEYFYDASNWKAFNQRAILLIHERRYEEAIGLLFEILPKFLKENMISEFARALHNVGFAHERQGKIEDAKFYYDQSMQVAEQISDHASFALTSADLANIYMSEGKIDIAEKLITKALQLTIPLHLEIRLRLYLAMCRTEEIEKMNLLLDVIDKADKCMDHELVAKFYRYLADLYKNQDNYEKAFVYSNLANERLFKKLELATKEL